MLSKNQFRNTLISYSLWCYARLMSGSCPDDFVSVPIVCNGSVISLEKQVRHSASSGGRARQHLIYGMLRVHFNDRKGPAMSSTASVSASEPTVILGATLIDGTGHDPISNAAIVIAGGRVRAVGPRATVTVPEGAHAIEAKGNDAAARPD